MIANIAYVNLRTPNIHLYRNTLQYFHIRSALTLPSVCPALKNISVIYCVLLSCKVFRSALTLPSVCPNTKLSTSEFATFIILKSRFI